MSGWWSSRSQGSTSRPRNAMASGKPGNRYHLKISPPSRRHPGRSSRARSISSSDMPRGTTLRTLPRGCRYGLLEDPQPLLEELVRDREWRGGAERPSVEAPTERGADPLGPVQQSVPLDGLDHLECRGAGDRVAAERPAQPTDVDALQHVRPSGYGRDREPAAQCLGRDHQVRHHVEVLDPEPASGSSESGLYLVGDEQDAVLPTELLQPGEEGRARHHEPALALDRLGYQARDVLGPDVLLHLGDRERRAP